MRTTIDFPPDLHSILTSLASSKRASLSQTAVELMRRGLEESTSGRGLLVAGVDEATGLPVVRFPRAITMEDVHAADDPA